MVDLQEAKTHLDDEFEFTLSKLDTTIIEKEYLQDVKEDGKICIYTHIYFAYF